MPRTNRVIYIRSPINQQTIRSAYSLARYLLCVFMLVAGWCGVVIMIYGESSDVQISKLFGSWVIPNCKYDPMTWAKFLIIAGIITPAITHFETLLFLAGISNELILSGWSILTYYSKVEMHILSMMTYTMIVTIISALQAFLIIMFVEYKGLHGVRHTVNTIPKTNSGHSSNVKPTKNVEPTEKRDVTVRDNSDKKYLTKVDGFNAGGGESMDSSFVVDTESFVRKQGPPLDSVNCG